MVPAERPNASSASEVHDVFQHLGESGIRHIELIADYGQLGDSAFGEVRGALRAAFPDATSIDCTSVPAFDTVGNGYILAQYLFGRGVHPVEGTLLFHNVAPRKDDPEPRRGNRGEDLWIGKLADSNVFVAGPASGYSWSVLRDQPVDIRTIPVAQKGSQFRSRDYFPKLVAEVIEGDKLFEKLERVERSSIPVYPRDQIAYVDGYGNIKLSSGPLRNAGPGETVNVTLKVPTYNSNGTETGKAQTVTRQAVVAGGSFSVAEGVLAFSSGSSGWRVNGHRVAASELFLRGGSAADYFGLPKTTAGQFRSGASVTTRNLKGQVLVTEPLTSGQSLSPNGPKGPGPSTQPRGGLI